MPPPEYVPPAERTPKHECLSRCPCKPPILVYEPPVPSAGVLAASAMLGIDMAPKPPIYPPCSCHGCRKAGYYVHPERDEQSGPADEALDAVQENLRAAELAGRATERTLAERSNELAAMALKVKRLHDLSCICRGERDPHCVACGIVGDTAVGPGAQSPLPTSENARLQTGTGPVHNVHGTTGNEPEHAPEVDQVPPTFPSVDACDLCGGKALLCERICEGCLPLWQASPEWVTWMADPIYSNRQWQTFVARTKKERSVTGLSPSEPAPSQGGMVTAPSENACCPAVPVPSADACADPLAVHTQTLLRDVTTALGGQEVVVELQIALSKLDLLEMVHASAKRRILELEGRLSEHRWCGKAASEGRGDDTPCRRVEALEQALDVAAYRFHQKHSGNATDCSESTCKSIRVVLKGGVA